MIARRVDVGEVPVASHASLPVTVLCAVISSSIKSRLGSGLVIRIDLIVVLTFVSRYAIWDNKIFSLSCIT